MRRESDCVEEKAPATGDGGAECAVRARKRKADVATFLQDPDEEIAKMEMTRKKQYENQPSWNNVHKNAHMLIPTPDKDDDPVGVDYSQFIHLSVVPTRASPLPVLGWANREDVWKNMINKEETYVRDKLYMQRHPLLQPKMRTILLDWLMEEIYPPKLHQFAYVTDGACTEDEILGMELIIMKALNWNLNPLTVVSWLNIYMQVAYLNEFYEVLLPQYPQQIFVQIAELLDLCVLDIGCLEYTYGVLAASALYHFSSSELMQKVSGYKWCEIEECVKWMVPFAMAIKEVGSSKLKHFRGIAPEDLHNIQTHINSLDLLDKAQAKQAILAEQNRTSPFPTGVLTPPQSSKKQSSGLKPI
ncbi:G1/S-specific cyclin-E1 isoform X2 [Grus americana]|uniref:G1/S-specific cyclin-E1 isoform X2 n=1 Tax=Grus americana TaxID=9117 RepID=UPI00240791CA|nr:G1/S-specific cyclin-E1 isoform X2 [Grus americana]